MKGITGVSLVTKRAGLPDVRENFAPDSGHRVVTAYWTEWTDAEGHHVGPRRNRVQQHGMLHERPVFAAAMILYGRSEFTIRNDSEVVINATGSLSRRLRRLKNLGILTKVDAAKAFVSQIYIDDRLVRGDELRGLLEKAIAARAVKAEKSKRRIVKLDKALAAIESERVNPETPFWHDPVEDGPLSE